MRAELMTIVVSQVDNLRSSFETGQRVSRLGAKRLEPHLLRRQRCLDAPGWLHLDYFRIATIRPEQLRETCARPRLICRPGYARNQVVGIVPPSIM